MCCDIELPRSRLTCPTCPSMTQEQKLKKCGPHWKAQAEMIIRMRYQNEKGKKNKMWFKEEEVSILKVEWRRYTYIPCLPCFPSHVWIFTLGPLGLHALLPIRQIYQFELCLRLNNSAWCIAKPNSKLQNSTTEQWTVCIIICGRNRPWVMTTVPDSREYYSSWFTHLLILITEKPEKQKKWLLIRTKWSSRVAQISRLSAEKFPSQFLVSICIKETPTLLTLI